MLGIEHTGRQNIAFGLLELLLKRYISVSVSVISVISKTRIFCPIIKCPKLKCPKFLHSISMVITISDLLLPKYHNISDFHFYNLERPDQFNDFWVKLLRRCLKHRLSTTSADNFLSKGTHIYILYILVSNCSTSASIKQNLKIWAKRSNDVRFPKTSTCLPLEIYQSFAFVDIGVHLLTC